MQFDCFAFPSVNAEFSIPLGTQCVPPALRGRKLNPERIEVADLAGLKQFTIFLDGQRYVYTAESWNPNPAGSSVNVSVGMKRLGQSVVLASAISKDVVGQMLQDMLEANGISTLMVPRGIQTPLSVAIIEPDGAAANFNCKPPYHMDTEGMLEKLVGVRARMAIATGVRKSELDLVFKIFTTRCLGQTWNSLTPNPSIYEDGECRDLLPQILRATDVLTMNEEEANLLLERSYDADVAAAKIAEMGPKVVAVTLDDRGSALAVFRNGKTEVLSQGVIKVNVRDKIGAGDAFHTGLLYGLDKGFSHEQSMLVGSYCAARNIEVVGSNSGLPTLAEVQHFLREEIPAHA